MTRNPPQAHLPAAEELERWLAQALDTAKREGATAAEASMSVGRGLSVSVRKGEVESVEFQRDRDLGVTVYFGHRTGSASTTELSEAALKETVGAACAIAKAAGEDPYVGLADPARMARVFPDLDLHHPWALSPDEAIELARRCEAAAFAADARIQQSEGASADTRESLTLYANSQGFLGHRSSTEHSIGCAPIAVSGEQMQVGHWYSGMRSHLDMETPEAVGKRAGERAAARLDPGEIKGGRMPVLFPPEVARGLFSHFVGAISGGALYRRASFLIDKLGQPVFCKGVNLRQDPFILRGAGSTAFDHEGTATAERVLVEDGTLMGYLLSSYSARKLGMETTGNAGGVFNLLVQPTYEGGFDALLKDMGEGLVITDLMGQGVSLVTGDYSRGAAGFYVKDGRIQYPVEEITIAGRLPEMYQGIRAIGSDIDARSVIRCGSVLLDSMMVAA